MTETDFKNNKHGSWILAEKTNKLVKCLVCETVTGAKGKQKAEVAIVMVTCELSSAAGQITPVLRRLETTVRFITIHSCRRRCRPGLQSRETQAEASSYDLSSEVT